jgi:hypothetical protein
MWEGLVLQTSQCDWLHDVPSLLPCACTCEQGQLQAAACVDVQHTVRSTIRSSAILWPTLKREHGGEICGRKGGAHATQPLHSWIAMNNPTRPPKDERTCNPKWKAVESDPRENPKGRADTRPVTQRGTNQAQANCPIGKGDNMQVENMNKTCGHAKAVHKTSTAPAAAKTAAGPAQ